MDQPDPFRHHPHLRAHVLPAAQSFFRDMDLAEIDARQVAAGRPPDWRTPDALREAHRRDWLKDHWGKDLWIFAYGSLMWDPSVEFLELRRARTPGFQRSFCLWDEGGRGSPEHPGLMLAIDEGGTCDGLAFRLAADTLDHETFVLFRREMIMPAYRPTWLTCDTAQGPLEALGFVADRSRDNIRPDLSRARTARMIARAEGELGTNFDYLANTKAHLDLLDIHDPYVASLLAEVRALR